MEVAGVAFRQAPCFASSAGDASNLRHSMIQSRSFCSIQQASRKSVEFSDKSHLQYYNGARMAIKEKETASMKKKVKLLKGLSKNLSAFSEMGFGLNPDDGLDYQVKGQMISEATEVLLGQLQKLKAEKLEYKMKKKEEKAKKKAARMMTMDCKKSESSSSSSSESESECVKVVSTSELKAIVSPPKEEISSSSCLGFGGGGVVEGNGGIVGVSKKIDESSVVGCDKKNKMIEVCMGGKCKKSGAAILMEKFEKAVVGEAVVVGCKCMGKCRDGPNVRVVGVDGDAVPVPVPNPLCIGVGTEDVDLIVNNFFGGDQSQRPVLALSSV